MSNQPYVIRTYRPGDFDSYVRLHVEAESFDRAGRSTSRQALGEGLRHPRYTPETDLFIAETGDGKVAGYMSVCPELAIGRAVLWHLVHPEHRDDDLITQLFDEALRRASSMGARVAHVNIPESDTAAGSLLSRLSFRPVRRFLELRLDLAELQVADAGRAGYSCRPLQHGEEDTLAEIQNRSFAGTWGYNPNTVEEIAYWVGLSCCRLEGIILVCNGDKPVGYCWTTINEEENPTEGAAGGRIHMMGVDPACRGKGIGRCALLAGLSYLKSGSIEVAELTVDSENREARALYDSVGFRLWSTSAWYEKALV